MLYYCHISYLLAHQEALVFFHHALQQHNTIILTMACFSVFLHLHLYIYNAYRYRNITANYYRNAQGIMLVYDVTSMKSFEAIDNWVR